MYADMRVTLVSLCITSRYSIRQPAGCQQSIYARFEARPQREGNLITNKRLLQLVIYDCLLEQPFSKRKDKDFINTNFVLKIRRLLFPVKKA